MHIDQAALKNTCLNPLVIRVECQHGRARNLASFDHRLEVRQKIHVFVHVSRQNLTFRAHNKAACKHTAPASSAPGWYLRQKPVGGGSKAGGLPTLPFPLSLPSPFPFPLHPFLTNGREGQIQWGGPGKFPGFPPLTNTTVVGATANAATTSNVVVCTGLDLS